MNLINKKNINDPYSKESVDSNKTIKKNIIFFEETTIIFSNSGHHQKLGVKNLLEFFKQFNGNVIVYGGKARKIIELDLKKTLNNEDTDFYIYGVSETIENISKLVNDFFAKYPIEIKDPYINKKKEIINFKITPKNPNFLNNKIDITFKKVKGLPYNEIHRGPLIDGLMVNFTKNEVIFPKIDAKNQELSLQEFLKYKKNNLSTGCSCEKYQLLKKAAPFFVYYYTRGYIDNDPELLKMIILDLNNIELTTSYIQNHVPLSYRIDYILHCFILLYGSKSSIDDLEKSWSTMYELIMNEENDKTRENSPFVKYIFKLDSSLESFEKFYFHLLSLIFTHDKRISFDKPIQIEFTEDKIEIKQPETRGAFDNHYFLFMPETIHIPLLSKGKHLVEYIDSDQKKLFDNRLFEWALFYSKSMLDLLLNDSDFKIDDKKPYIISKDVFSLSLLMNFSQLKEKIFFDGLILLLNQIDCDFSSLNENQKKWLSEVGMICLPIFLLNGVNSKDETSVTEFHFKRLSLILSFIPKNEKITFPDNHPQIKEILVSILNYIDLLKDSTETNEPLLDTLIDLYMNHIDLKTGLKNTLSIASNIKKLQKKLSFIFKCLEKSSPSISTTSTFEGIAQILLKQEFFLDKKPLLEKNEIEKHWRSWIALWSRIKSVYKNECEELKSLYSLLETTFQKLNSNSSPHLLLLMPSYLESINLNPDKQLAVIWCPTIPLDLKIDLLMNLKGTDLTIDHWPIIKSTIEIFIKIASKELEGSKKYIFDFSLPVNNTLDNPIQELCLVWGKIIQNLNKTDKKKTDEKTLKAYETIIVESEDLFTEMIALFDESSVENNSILLSWIIDLKTPILTYKNFTQKYRQNDNSTQKICAIFSKHLSDQNLLLQCVHDYNTFFYNLSNFSSVNVLPSILQIQIMLFTKWLELNSPLQNDIDKISQAINNITRLSKKHDIKNGLSEGWKLYLNFSEKIFKESPEKALPFLNLLESEQLPTDELNQIFQKQLQDLILVLLEKKTFHLMNIKNLCLKLEFNFIEKNEALLLVETLKKRLLKLNPKEKEIAKEISSLFTIFTHLSPFYSHEELEEIGLYFMNTHLNKNSIYNWIIKNKIVNFSAFEKIFNEIQYPEKLKEYLLKILLATSKIHPFDFGLFFKITHESLSSNEKPSIETWRLFFDQLAQIVGKIDFTLEYAITPLPSHFQFLIKNSDNKSLFMKDETLSLSALKSLDILNSLFVFPDSIALCRDILIFMMKNRAELFLKLIESTSFKTRCLIIKELIDNATIDNQYLELASQWISKQEKKDLSVIYNLFQQEEKLYNEIRSETLTHEIPNDDKKKIESLKKLYAYSKKIINSKESEERSTEIKDVLALISQLSSDNSLSNILYSQFETILLFIMRSEVPKEYELIHEFCMSEYNKRNLIFIDTLIDNLESSVLYKSDLNLTFEIFEKQQYKTADLPSPSEKELGMSLKIFVFNTDLALLTTDSLPGYNFCIGFLQSTHKKVFKLCLQEISLDYENTIANKIITDFPKLHNRMDNSLKADTFISILNFTKEKKLVIDQTCFFNFILFVLNNPAENLKTAQTLLMHYTASSYTLAIYIIKNYINSINDFETYCFFIENMLKFLAEHPIKRHRSSFLLYNFLLHDQIDSKKQFDLKKNISINTTVHKIHTKSKKLDTHKLLKDEKKENSNFFSIDLSQLLIDHIIKYFSEKTISYDSLGMLLLLMDSIQESVQENKKALEKYIIQLINLAQLLENSIIYSPISNVYKWIRALYKNKNLNYSDYITSSKSLCRGLLNVLNSSELHSSFSLIIKIFTDISTVIGQNKNDEYIDFILNLLPLIHVKLEIPLTNLGNTHLGVQSSYNFSYYTESFDISKNNPSIQKITSNSKLNQYCLEMSSHLHDFLNKNFIPYIEKQIEDSELLNFYLKKIDLFLNDYLYTNSKNQTETDSIEITLSQCQNIGDTVLYSKSLNEETIKELLENLNESNFSNFASTFQNALKNEVNFDYLDKKFLLISEINFNKLKKIERNLIFKKLLIQISCSITLNVESINSIKRNYFEIIKKIPEKIKQSNNLDMNAFFLMTMSCINQGAKAYKKYALSLFKSIDQQIDNSEDKIEWYINFISLILDQPQVFCRYYDQAPPSEYFNYIELSIANINKAPLFESMRVITRFLYIQNNSPEEKIQFTKKTLQELGYKQYDRFESLKENAAGIYWFFSIRFIATYLQNYYCCATNTQLINVNKNIHDNISTAYSPDFSFDKLKDRSCITFDNEDKVQFTSLILHLFNFSYLQNLQNSKTFIGILNKLKLLSNQLDFMRPYIKERVFDRYFSILYQLNFRLSDQNISNPNYVRLKLIELLEIGILDYFFIFDNYKNITSDFPYDKIQKYLDVIEEIRNEKVLSYTNKNDEYTLKNAQNDSVLDDLVQLLLISISSLQIDFDPMSPKDFQRCIKLTNAYNPALFIIANYIIKNINPNHPSESLIDSLQVLLERLINHDEFPSMIEKFTSFLSNSGSVYTIQNGIEMCQSCKNISIKSSMTLYTNLSTSIINLMKKIEFDSTIIALFKHCIFTFHKNCLTLETFTLLFSKTNSIIIEVLKNNTSYSEDIVIFAKQNYIPSMKEYRSNTKNNNISKYINEIEDYLEKVENTETLDIV